MSLQPSLSFGPRTLTACPVDSTTPVSMPTLAAPPANVPPASGAPVNFALLIVTPGPTSCAASAAALFDCVTVLIFGTSFAGLGGAVRASAASDDRDKSATAVATITRLAAGMRAPGVSFAANGHSPPVGLP